MEEQGINTLYLAFGLLKWKEAGHSSIEITSPLILVPVRLTIESLSSPYKMELHEDEIVVNPTLAYKLDNDFGIKLPAFDNGDTNIEEYCSSIDRLIRNKDWELKRDVNLTLLSFLKINMYKDLERNEEKLHNNPIISAIVGDGDNLDIPEDYNDFDHDAKVRPIDTYQVVDADSSQMDAILLSKNGSSFVLQGPPGTGKSQTITNIIAEGLADGKKILFVSEKMAALKVVHNRLEQVGLSDFCLTLHSHKANKKEILQDLSDSINQNKTRVREEIISQLDTLERIRNTLNDYSNELHTKCQPMGWSVYDVNGKLAKLNHIPDIIFAIDKINYLGPNELNNIRYLLDEFSRTIGKKSEDYSENPWRNAIVPALTNELRHDIDAHLSVLIPVLKDLDYHQKLCCNDFELDFTPTINNSRKVKTILACAGKSPIIPREWILSDGIEELRQKANRCKTVATTAKEKKEALLRSCDDSILMLSGREIQLTIDTLSEKLMAILSAALAPNNEVMMHELAFISEHAAELHDYLMKVYAPISKLRVDLGLETPTNYIHLANTVDIIECLSHGMSPTKHWFDKGMIPALKEKVQEYSKISSELRLLNSQIDNVFDKEIYTIDYYSLLKKFRSEYNSIFRIFKANYRSDIRFLQSLTIHGDKLAYKEVIPFLNKLKTINEYSERIKSDAELISWLGNSYNGLNTDWNGIENQLNNFDKLLGLFHDGKLPVQLIELYKSSNIPYKTISIVLQHYSEFKKNAFNEKVAGLINTNITEESNLPELLDTLTTTRETSELLNKAYHSITDKLKSQKDYNSVITCINDLAILQEAEKEIVEQKALLERLFDFYWQGDTTDWDGLVDALAYSTEFKAIVEENKLPDSFIKEICLNKNTIEKAKYAAEIYSKLLDKAELQYGWFSSLFDSKENLPDVNITDLVTRFTSCRDHKSLLEEWVDYRNNRDKCREIGLSEYIDQVESLKINPDYIVDSFLKRFYRLWLDAVSPDFPAIQSFRGSSHEQIITNFKHLDSFQQTIARSRIRERVLSRMPDFNSITASRDEIGILKRELNKQRRIMPLRKLFNSIPNLLTSLRPCLMMSPLSVSVYLEAQSYEFDMIIFDEASQVCTEDAIGAIMRGKQVIIVGDQMQLPPTSFFSTALNDGDDFDTDDEDTEVGAYESILNEALKALPERSLLWHYRSKHEHLIAFSNYKIYNKRLITFPSCDNKSDDTGVEYIYVKDGVYDRGGKRNNRIEAAKVADMVFTHFIKYPNRSLGVVTFSEAQQHAVETAITKLRIADSSFDHFFSEETEEPFFIKNLENVQGDERDTIIFSIGYAKDGTGRAMAMNLGPLSRDGGERRLNVAITRAKFNVKLVGSIQPHDLDLERTTASGVRLLRSYIEFAQQGMSAIHHEVNTQTYGDSESPFEEAVYDYLTSKGYVIDTQVGCSGYRIDMAVKHPQKTNKYILGVECDGATYHSSRTARERDRLRQEVLENMGWKIHRVWSTDWIKDPVTEGEKIISAIDIVLNSTELHSNGHTTNDASVSYTPIDEVIQNFDGDESSSLGFEIYKEANIHEINQSFGDESSNYVARIILHIITTEQPIHFDMICKRIAPIFGRKKASSHVKYMTDIVIQSKLKDRVIVKENFYQLKSLLDIKVRVPGENGESRQIQYVSNDEICEAMMIVAVKSYGTKSTDLMTTTARALGYSKCGVNIIAAMDKAYKTLISAGKLKEIDGKVNLM